jgi:hypothetical protein
VAYLSADNKALHHAGHSGVLTVNMADRLAVRLLGLTLWHLWPEDEWSPSPAA